MISFSHDAEKWQMFEHIINLFVSSKTQMPSVEKGKESQPGLKHKKLENSQTGWKIKLVMKLKLIYTSISELERSDYEG